MRKIVLFLCAFLAVSSFFSCRGKKEQIPVSIEENAIAFTFSKQDTTEVLNLVNQFISRLENNDIPAAVDMLSFLDGDSIIPLTPQFKNRQARTLASCKGIAYKVDKMVLNSETDNEVKMDIVLFEKPEGEPIPNTTSFYFRPILYQGKWYLTTRDNITETSTPDLE